MPQLGAWPITTDSDVLLLRSVLLYAGTTRLPHGRRSGPHNHEMCIHAGGRWPSIPRKNKVLPQAGGVDIHDDSLHEHD